MVRETEKTLPTTPILQKLMNGSFFNSLYESFDFPVVSTLFRTILLLVLPFS